MKTSCVDCQSFPSDNNVGCYFMIIKAQERLRK